MKDLSQKPEQEYIGNNSRDTDWDMILQHPFKVIYLSRLSPIPPGPEIVQDEIIQYWKLNSQETGEKVKQL